MDVQNTSLTDLVERLYERDDLWIEDLIVWVFLRSREALDQFAADRDRRRPHWDWLADEGSRYPKRVASLKVAERMVLAALAADPTAAVGYGAPEQRPFHRDSISPEANFWRCAAFYYDDDRTYVSHRDVRRAASGPLCTATVKDASGELVDCKFGVNELHEPTVTWAWTLKAFPEADKTDAVSPAEGGTDKASKNESQAGTKRGRAGSKKRGPKFKKGWKTSGAAAYLDRQFDRMTKRKPEDWGRLLNRVMSMMEGHEDCPGKRAIEANLTKRFKALEEGLTASQLPPTN